MLSEKTVDQAVADWPGSGTSGKQGEWGATMLKLPLSVFSAALRFVKNDLLDKANHTNN